MAMVIPSMDVGSSIPMIKFELIRGTNCLAGKMVVNPVFFLVLAFHAVCKVSQNQDRILENKTQKQAQHPKKAF